MFGIGNLPAEDALFNQRLDSPALEAYNPAVNPAGPPPTMMTS